MVALRKQTPSNMTVDEFLAWLPDDGSVRGWQLIDGAPMAMAPARERHAIIQGQLVRQIGNHLEDRPGLCRVAVTPGIVPRARATHNYRIPDIAVTCSPLGNDVTISEPNILIEVLSPSNEADTRANVWAYTTTPSAREILIVRSTRIEAELLRRRDDGSWLDEPAILGPNDTIVLMSIDFTMTMRSLYRRTSLA
jgi:Uma2 family endonuclease